MHLVGQLDQRNAWHVLWSAADNHNSITVRLGYRPTTSLHQCQPFQYLNIIRVVIGASVGHFPTNRDREGAERISWMIYDILPWLLESTVASSRASSPAWLENIGLTSLSSALASTHCERAAFCLSILLLVPFILMHALKRTFRTSALLDISGVLIEVRWQLAADWRLLTSRTVSGGETSA